MTQQARNRRKGAEWEIDLRNYLRREGFDVERLRLTGKNDEGDLVIRNGDEFEIIECKNAIAFNPGEFMTEACLEADNYAKHRDLDRKTVRPLVIVKRRNRPWREAYVMTTVEEYFDL